MTLIDVVVASGLILVVFLGFFGIFQAATVLVSSGKSRAGAVALALERMEYIRSLPYNSVGTAGGIPSGAIAQSESLSLNQTSYTRRTLIQYVDDPKDGLGAGDLNGITADYKVAKVELTWSVKGNPRVHSLISSVVPKGIESLQGGGTLTIRAINALGAAVPSASVRIYNNTGTTTIDVTAFTNSAGQVSFPGTPAGGGYQITVGKEGYSTAKTYSSDSGNPNPAPNHPSVGESQTSVSTFAIDALSSLTLRTWRLAQAGFWSDPFEGGAQVSTSTDIVITGGAAALATTSEGSVPSGELYSVDIAPPYLDSWSSFSWSSTTPAATSLVVRLYTKSGNTLTLLPDAILPGNSAGFAVSPVSLTAVSSSTYLSLALGGTLTTADTSATPAVLDWRIDYEGGPTPLPDIPFHLRGEKTIGTDGADAPIYKFSQDLSTDASALFSTTTLEWDSYTATFAGSGYVISTTSEPQPFSLLPGASKTFDAILAPQ